MNLVDIISDFAQGQDVLDLSDLFASLPIGDRPINDGAANSAVNLTTDATSTHVLVDNNGTAAGGTFVEVAALTGVNATIAILYDDNQPNHTTNVT